LQLILNAKTAAFAEGNPWFGKARENVGDPANFWWEGSVEAGVQRTLNIFGGSELYGAYSYLYAQTVGHNAREDLLCLAGKRQRIQPGFTFWDFYTNIEAISYIL